MAKEPKQFTGIDTPVNDPEPQDNIFSVVTGPGPDGMYVVKLFRIIGSRVEEIGNGKA